MLSRYPMESRIAFIECGGNSLQLYQKDPAPLDCQDLQGLVSCAEWTGVKLSTLLDEAGIEPTSKWILAEGADAAGMSRSVPLAKAMDDALIALFQNGERIRPSNGYPIRLLLPGYEGNMHVKWLRRIKVTEGPTMTKDETSKYTMLLPDGKSLQFVFPIETKSVITQPSPGLTMKGPGLYEISGLAWSGYGAISKVEVSAGGGQSWAPAALQQPVLSMALTRFRMAWRWNGGPAVLQSRATDDAVLAMFSRRAPSSSPSAATRHSTITTGLRAGALLRMGRLSMSMPSRLFAAALTLAVLSDAAFCESPNLGRIAAPEEIASWDISIGPNGAGLPPGSGTPKQGEAVYTAKCLICHGEKGAGKPNDALVGVAWDACGRSAAGQNGWKVSGPMRRRFSITCGEQCHLMNRSL